MKRHLLLGAIAIFLVFSCSTDKEDSLADEGSIEGKWKFSELNIDNASSPNEIKLANEVIKFLISQGCEILTFDFKADKTVIANYRDFTQTGNDVNPEGTGLLIECPTTVETDTSTWSLQGNQLTITDGDGIGETITIELNEDTLTIPAEFVDKDNLQGAKAIFARK